MCLLSPCAIWNIIWMTLFWPCVLICGCNDCCLGMPYWFMMEQITSSFFGTAWEMVYQNGKYVQTWSFKIFGLCPVTRTFEMGDPYELTFKGHR